MSRKGASGDDSIKRIDRDDPRLTPPSVTATQHGARTLRHTKKMVFAGASILTLGALAACSGAEENIVDHSAQSAYSETLSATDSAPDGTTEQSSDSAPQPSSERASDRAEKRNLCRTEHLDVTIADQQGAAGSTLFDIVFKNTGSDDCVLRGYPGVSMVTDNNGTQLGASAEREKTKDIPAVSLQSGEKAFSSVRVTNVGALDPAECHSRAADGIRVYPPDETRSAYVKVNGIEGCSGKPKFMTIQPVQADRTR